MKLNPDCVRDVLLYLEENLTLIDDDYSVKIEHKDISLTSIIEELTKDEKYKVDEIKYSVEKLLGIGFISSKRINIGANKSIISCPISDITWDGHQFLNTIRPKTIWNATKEKAKQFGGMSIGTLSMLATELTKAVITHPNYINKIVEQINEIIKNGS